jgi:hypothetical protein
LIENKIFYENTPCQWQFDVKFLCGPSSQYEVNNRYNIYFNIAGPSPSGSFGQQLLLTWGLTLKLKYVTFNNQPAEPDETDPLLLNPVPALVKHTYSDYICYPGSLSLDVSGATIWITGLNCGVGLPKYTLVNSWQSLANFPDYPAGNEAFVKTVITPSSANFRIGYQESDNQLIIYKTSMDIFGIQPQDIDASAGYPINDPHVTIDLYW